MLIYITIITLVIVLCLYKMSTKNVNYMEDDEDELLAFHYMRGGSGGSTAGSGSSSGGGKKQSAISGNVPNVAAFSTGGSSSLQAAKEKLKSTYGQYAQAVQNGSMGGRGLQELSGAADSARRQYEAALQSAGKKIPEIGQLNRSRTAVYTQAGWVTANNDNVNINSQILGNAPAINDGINWVSVQDGSFLRRPA